MGTVTYFMKLYLTMEKYIGYKIGDCPYFPTCSIGIGNDTIPAWDEKK